jgi:hypothetical protein
MDAHFEAIEVSQGFIARRDVLEVGLDDRFIRRQRALRLWVRIRKGAYCLIRTWEQLDALERHRRIARAVLHSHGDAVALTRVSGLVMRTGCDVWGIDLSRVHVVRRDGRSGGIEPDVVHQDGPVRDDDLEVVDGLLVVKEANCVVEVLLRAGVEPGLTVIDSALHAGRVEKAEMRDLVDGMLRRKGHRTADLVVRLADGRAASVGESRSRYLYWSQGLPRPEVQFQVFGVDGRLVGTCDLGWPGHRLLFEFDGRVKYGRLLKPGQDAGDVVWAEKLREDELRRVTGWAVERATWGDLSRPVELARRTRARMSRRDDTA